MVRDYIRPLWGQFRRYCLQKPKSVISTVFIILAISAGLGFFHKNKLSRVLPLQTAVAVPVRTAKAARRDVENTISLVGTVHPMATVAIKSRIDSQITQVKFKDGDTVREGDVLFILDDRILKAQLQQLSADLSRFSAELDRAARQLQRDDKLSRRGYASQSVYDTSKSTYEAARANVDSIKASIRNVQTQLDFTVIRAPISGRVGTINVTLGNTVKANDTVSLVTINQMRPVKVTAPVPQRYFQAIQTAMKKGSAQVTALDSTGVILDKGVILYKENAIDEETRTLSVQAIFDNKNDQLWPGMYVDVNIALGMERQVMTLPLASVQIGQDFSYVYAVHNGKAIIKPVKILQNHLDQAVIEGDITEGEEIITQGFLSLKDNMPVTIRQAEARKVS